MADNEYGGGPDPVQEQPEQMEGGGGGEFASYFDQITLMTNLSFQKRRTGVKTGAGARMVTERAEEAGAGLEAVEAGEDLADAG